MLNPELGHVSFVYYLTSFELPSLSSVLNTSHSTTSILVPRNGASIIYFQMCGLRWLKWMAGHRDRFLWSPLNCPLAIDPAGKQVWNFSFCLTWAMDSLERVIVLKTLVARRRVESPFSLPSNPVYSYRPPSSPHPSRTASYCFLIRSIGFSQGRIFEP